MEIAEAAWLPNQGALTDVDILMPFQSENQIPRRHPTKICLYMSHNQFPTLGFSRYWWMPLVSGLISIALGIWTLFCPAESLTVLAYVFAICFTVAGLFYIGFAAFASRWSSDWGWILAFGIMEAVLGVWLLCLPAAQLTVAFMYIAGFGLLFAAIGAVGESFAASAGSVGWTVVSVIFLLLTIAFTMVFLSNPIAGGVAVWLWLGLSLISFGVFRLVLAGKMRQIGRFTGGVL